MCRLRSLISGLFSFTAIFNILRDYDLWVKDRLIAQLQCYLTSFAFAVVSLADVV
jgi:hypothetical protein